VCERERDRNFVCHVKVRTKVEGVQEQGDWENDWTETELHNLYYSSDIIRMIKSRRMRWAGQVARMGEMRIAYKILVGHLEGKRLFGGPRHRWEDNIKTYPR
jgi:hypothetical protein